MRLRLFAVGATTLMMAGCVMPGPVVTDYNGDSVKVTTIAWTDAKPTPEAAYEAERICKTGGKNRAEYASTRVNPNTSEAEHLYLCL